MRDGLVDAIGRLFEQIRKSYDEPAVAQPDGCVQAGEATKFDLQRRHRRARTQSTILLLEDRENH
jgi:hypothetical protein